jgi:hypothetical protein
MDDIKLYAKNEQELHKMIREVNDYSNRIKMKFGLEKCKIVHINRGKLKTDSNEFVLSSGESIETMKHEADCYKYLGILQLNDIKHEDMKSQIKKEYRKRIRAVLNTQLTAKHKIISINTLAIPVVRYTGGIIKWTQSELQEMDRNTRKLMTCYRGFAKRSDVNRLYTMRKDGGRSLISVEDCIKIEESSILQYRKRSTQTVLRKETGEEIDAKQVKVKIQNERREGWMKKILHGQYTRQLPNGIDINQTFSWLLRGKLSIETEGFISAAQEQAIHTRAIAKNIYKTIANDKCRICGGHSETVMHIAAECSNIAQTEYLERHNIVARYLHYRLLQIHGVDLEGVKWYQHQPNRVV